MSCYDAAAFVSEGWKQMEEIKTACCECETVIQTEVIDAIIETKSPIKVKRKVNKKKSATLQQMMVESATTFEYDEFNKTKIIESLEKEAGLNNKDAKEIANTVEKKLIDAKMENPSTGLIREIINSILVDKGYKKELESYSNLSIPLINFEDIIYHHGFENSNTSPSPEFVNLAIAENMIKQYQFKSVFTKDVADAHRKGQLHVHDVGHLRPYCSGNSPLFVIKHGLRFPGAMSASKPAKHPLTLVNHITAFSSYLQGTFSGAIGFDALNVFFAPFFSHSSWEEIKQCAQHMIYTFSQLAANRGAQTCFSDLNVFMECPDHYKDTPAIGPGGKETGKTYGEYRTEIRAFLKAIFAVIAEGDADGANFCFPKILLHLNKSTFDANDELFKLACEINAKRGSIYILFDRDEVQVSMCCRLKTSISADTLEIIKRNPDQLRFSALQNISINMPRIAYQFNTEKEIFSEIDRLVDLAGKAHVSKYKHICQMLDLGSKGPLSFLANNPMSNEPYLRREDAKFLIGMVGLNEMVLKHTGKEMHEDENSYKFALKAIAHMKLSMDAMALKYNINCVLEESPAESTSGRFALLDIKYFPTIAHNFVKGIAGESEYKYYTNSVHLSYSSNIDVLTRLIKQAKFAPMIQAGQIIHVWLGESNPDPKSIGKLIEIAMFQTNAPQIAFSPDFTTCQDCHSTDKGLFGKCKRCGSEKVYSITRVSGYFSKISGWSRGKLAELADRTRDTITTEAIKINNATEEIVFFSKPNCQKCDVAKDRLKQSNHNIKVYDTSTDEGLAMACYYNVDDLPAMMKVKGDQIINSWSHDTSMIKWLKQNLEA